MKTSVEIDNNNFKVNINNILKETVKSILKGLLFYMNAMNFAHATGVYFVHVKHQVRFARCRPR